MEQTPYEPALRDIERAIRDSALPSLGRIANAVTASHMSEPDRQRVASVLGEAQGAAANTLATIERVLAAETERLAEAQRNVLYELAIAAEAGEGFAASFEPTAPNEALLRNALRVYREQLGQLRNLRARLTTEHRVIPLPSTSKTARDVVVLIHGIRTESPWGESVAEVVRRSGSDAAVIRYAYIDVFRFLIPWFREPAIRALYNKLEPLLHDEGIDHISVIAHSFGSYAISRILLEHPHVRLRRLVLCGSIVPADFPWDRVYEQLDDRVLNECGTKDIWPLLASGLTVGFGPSGTFGFGTWKVRDRFHPFRHSDFFDPQFVEDAWLPYFSDGLVVEAGGDWVRQTPPWWQSVIARLPLWAVPLAAVLVSVWLLG